MDPLPLSTLRSLFRNLQAFESLFESAGVDVLTDHEGRDWALQDIRYLYSCRVLLSRRQRQAIELCFYDNICEREAARLMGISQTAPVSIYANNGLRRLIVLAEDGALPRFQPERVAA